MRIVAGQFRFMHQRPEQQVGLRLRLAQESLTDPMRRRFAAAALVLILVLAFLAVRQVQSQQPQGVLGSQKLAYPSLESQLSDLVERAVAAPETAPTLAEEAPLSEGTVNLTSPGQNEAS